MKRISGALGFVFLNTISLFAQCPLCKNTLTHSPQGRLLVENLNTAIVVLLTAPFVIIGLVIYGVWRMKSKDAVGTPEIPAPKKK